VYEHAAPKVKLCASSGTPGSRWLSSKSGPTWRAAVYLSECGTPPFRIEHLVCFGARTGRPAISPFNAWTCQQMRSW